MRKTKQTPVGRLFCLLGPPMHASMQWGSVDQDVGAIERCNRESREVLD